MPIYVYELTDGTTQAITRLETQIPGTITSINVGNPQIRTIDTAASNKDDLDEIMGFLGFDAMVSEASVVLDSRHDFGRFTTANEPAVNVSEGDTGYNTTLGAFVFYTGAAWSTVGGGGTFLGSFDVNDVIFPSTNPAAATSRNGHPLIAYDDTTAQSILRSDTLSSDYSGGDVSINIDWVAATATTGDVVWGVEIERIAPGGTDIDADSFDTQQTGTDTTNGTSGIITRTTITLTNAQADAWAAGDAFRLRLQRVAASGSDTMTGDAQISRVSLEQ